MNRPPATEFWWDGFRRAVEKRMKEDSISYGRMAQLAEISPTELTTFLSGCAPAQRTIVALSKTLGIPAPKKPRPNR